jgi:Tfp pilus assembly protein PilV
MTVGLERFVSMSTFPETTRGRGRRRGSALDAARRRLRRARAGGEDGFLLIEVIVSALLVAMIVVATFNGLDVAGKISADQRRHDEAAILAAQSQEQLRSLPSTALVVLETIPHKYTRTVNGTTYTITQSAKAAGSVGKEETVGCAVTNTSSEVHNIQITSSVTWALLKLKNTERPAVKESSVITPPTGSAIEVDVVNGLNEGVSGVTARAVFTPTGTTQSNTIEGTTDNAGCVILSNLQTTSAEVEIQQRTGFVTRSGALSVPNKRLTIAPNVTTHDVVAYAEAGRIAAKYTYKGATEWNGEKVVGDTFIAQHVEEFEAEPKYEVGATYFEYEGSEEEFTPFPGTCDTATACVPRNKTVPAYEPIAYTAAGSKYPNGDLFPFKAPWVVWAGDCEANETGDVSVASKNTPEVGVTSGQTATVNVPLGYTQLSVYKGKGEGKPEALVTEHQGPVKITNAACESAALPPHANAQTFVHEQAETLASGRLEDPFQPFGTFTLCMVSKTEKQTYTVPFTNEKASTPSTPKIYLKQRPNATISSERAAKEAEVKTEEPYKARSGAKAEYEADKTKANGYEGAYKKYETEYKTAEGNYKKYETEYKTAEGNYKNLEAKYKTEKTNWEVKKVEPYKANYLKYEKEYLAEKTNYNTLKGKYETEKTNYNTLKGKYEAEKTNYNTYTTKYKKEEAEYEGYLEYTSDSAEAATLKTEDEEAKKSGVTVKAGTTC